MANIKSLKRKPIMIQLDKEREVKFTLGSMALLEEEYGSIDQALKIVNDGKMKDIIFFVWSAVVHEDDTITKQKVANSIDVRDINDIMEVISMAITSDLPDGEPKEGKADGELEKK